MMISEKDTKTDITSSVSDESSTVHAKKVRLPTSTARILILPDLHIIIAIILCPNTRF